MTCRYQSSASAWVSPKIGNVSARAEVLMTRYETFTEELTSILYRAVHTRK